MVNLLQNSPPGTDASHGQASAALLQALALLARVVGAYTWPGCLRVPRSRAK